MRLSSIEEDILGDLSQDSHELWEWYAFFRLHFPDLSEDEIIKAGRELLGVWIQRDWLKVSKSRKDPRAIKLDEFLKVVDDLGSRAGDPDEATILLDLSNRPYNEISWLPSRRQ